MDNLNSDYQPLPSYRDTGDDTPLDDGRSIRYQYAPERSNARWNHIVDLDSFFTRVYQYHQKHGFRCMMLKETFVLMQFIFTVVFAIYITQCVDYPILFRDKILPNSTKVHFSDAIIPIKQCLKCLPVLYIICVSVAIVICLLSVARVVYCCFQNLEMKEFFNSALKIDDSELDNMTWHEVQRRLQEVQREQQMCIHKQELTELDIYHRILRYKNYMVAMVNKDIVPLKIKFPLIGEQVILSKTLIYNLEYLILKGYDAPFTQWTLRDEYKILENRTALAQKLAKRSFYLGLLNLVLCPLITIWGLLYSILSYGELVKREPGRFGTRHWSLYGKLYLRHFNELDHELNARLNRAYKPATKYMNIFSSHTLCIISKNVMYVAGSIFIVIVALSLYDEVILQVEHALTVLGVCGAIIGISQAFIPDENLVWCPEKLMTAVLAQIHYMPHHWQGNSHTMKVRNEFGQFFQYKSSYMLTELTSSLTSALYLMFILPKHMEKVVDFLRNFTVSVVGVGDVCSFAQMDVRKHGSPQWAQGHKQTIGFQTKNAKTELSLMHFTLTNPDWKPPNESTAFIARLKERVAQDANHFGDVMREDNPFYYSLYSLSSLGGGYSSLVQSLFQNNQSMSGSLSTPWKAPAMVGGLPRIEGPAHYTNSGILSSLQPVVGSVSSAGEPSYVPAPNELRFSENDNVEVDFNSADMSFSALYLNKLGRNESRHGQAEVSDRMLWPQPQAEMENIIEIPQEEDNCETMPLLDLRTFRSS